MANLNLKISIIALNVNGLNTSVRDWQCGSKCDPKIDSLEEPWFECNDINMF